MILQLLHNGILDGCSPEGIHFTRPILALYLVQGKAIPDISYWVQGTQEASHTKDIMMTKQGRDVLSSHSHNAIIANTAIKHIDENLRSNSEDKEYKRRPQLPRSVKLTPVTETALPIPAGRKVHIWNEDTYVADSTINDASEGIDAGWGLFAGKDFDPDSPYPDDDLVAYYAGTPMTEDELAVLLSNPTPDKVTGFILSFQGIIIDGWDHTNNRYAGTASAINDFLDDRNNCQISKELVPNANKRKRGTFKLAIRTKKFTSQHTEFGFAYGESAFCNQLLPVAVLFKAARYYYNEIMSSESARTRWSQLPHARYLFNSPYHGASPFTTEKTIKSILHHIRSCGNSTCTCAVENLLALRQHQKHVDIITKVIKSNRPFRNKTFKQPRRNT